MLAVFCLRLAAGMMACLLLLSPAQINPRFYRTHFLTALGLLCAALLLVRETGSGLLLGVLALGMVLAFAGSFVWSLEGAPGGRTLVALATVAAAAGLYLTTRAAGAAGAVLPLLGEAASALLLGAATTAMLMGHSYLIAPSMSITPLMRLLGALTGALLLRMTLDGVALGLWTRGHSFTNLADDMILWLPVRWLVGFLLPLGLTWMAWQTARIRSTQSATGILYVVVIFSFLGELTSQLLRDSGLTF